MTDVLADFLRAYPRAYRPIGPPDPLGGGLSGAMVWRFDSAAGPLVARAWPMDFPDDRLARIHRWLGQVADLEFLATPIPDREGRTFHALAGRSWELARFLPGRPLGDRPPGLAEIQAALPALARFHQRLGRSSTVGISPGLTDRLRELVRFMASESKELADPLAVPDPGPLATAARRWLSLARAGAGDCRDFLESHHRLAVPIQPCLRDLRADHLLFEGDQFRGLVDYGAMGEETVAADLARLFAEWIGPDRSLRQAALDAYESIRPLDLAEIRLIEAFERSANLLGGLHWLRWHYLEGRRFEPPTAVLEGVQRSLGRLEHRELQGPAPAPWLPDRSGGVAGSVIRRRTSG